MSALSSKREEKFLPAKEVAVLVGYTPDYVSRLAREGKVSAERRGRSWFVDADSVKLFLLEAEQKKRSRNVEIRDERIAERARFHNEIVEEKISAAISDTRNHAILQTAVVALCLFVVSNLVWFSVEEDLRVDRIASGAVAVAAALSDRVITPIPEAISQVAAFAFVDQPEVTVEEVEAFIPVGTDAADSESVDFQGVILLNEKDVTAEEIQKLKDSFSDEVRVEFDGDETGVITPVFREIDGDSYRFLLVPVVPEETK